MAKTNQEEQRKAPILRFKGFTNDWEQGKLGEFSYIKGRIGWKSLKHNEYLLKGPALIASKHINNGQINWNMVDHISDWRYEESPEIMLKINDIIFSKDGAIGNPAIIKFLPCKATINSTMMLVRLDLNTMYADFFYQILVSNQFKRLVFEKTSGSSIPHIFQSDMKEFKFCFPCLKEQKIIYKMLNKLDYLLALYERKSKLLSQIKEYLLDNLFAENEYPNLRFKGFTNVWEQRMVSDIGKIVGGGTPSTKNPKFWNGNINWFSPNEINIKRYVTESNKKITKEGLKKSSAKILPAKNTILFTSRATIGEMALLTIDSATNQGFQSFVLNNNVSRYFIFSLQNKIKKIALKKASGSTFLEISKKEVEKIKINIPSLKEQKKIANLFKLVDDYLALYESKLKQIKQIKKELLDTMFI